MEVKRRSGREGRGGRWRNNCISIFQYSVETFGVYGNVVVGFIYIY